MQILTKQQEYIIFEALSFFTEAVQADLDSGTVSEVEKVYVLKMLDDALALKARYAPVIE